MPNGEAEFVYEDFAINSKIRKGNEILRETFKRDINVFAAPYERISRPVWKSLRNNGLNLCRRFTVGRLIEVTAFSGLSFHKIIEMLMASKNPSKLVPDNIIDMTNILVVQWDFLISSVQGLRPPLEEAKEGLRRRLARDESFIVLHHFWEYFREKPEMINQDLLEILNSFLKYVSSLNNVWKTNLSEICYAVKKDNGGL